MSDEYIIRLQRRIELVRKMKALLFREKYDDDDRRACVYEFWRTIGGPLTPAERASQYRDRLRHENVTDLVTESVTEIVTKAPSSSSVVPKKEELEAGELPDQNGSKRDAAVTPPLVIEWGSAEALVLLYNRLAPAGHPRVTRLTPARREKSRKYLRDFPDEKFWTGVFSEIQFSAFLRGRANGDSHKSFRADFDWLLTRGKDGTENAIKVQEGKYRDA